MQKVTCLLLTEGKASDTNLRRYIAEHLQGSVPPPRWGGEMMRTSTFCQPTGSDSVPALVSQVTQMCSRGMSFQEPLNDGVGKEVRYRTLTKQQWEETLAVYQALLHQLQQDGAMISEVLDVTIATNT